MTSIPDGGESLHSPFSLEPRERDLLDVTADVGDVATSAALEVYDFRRAMYHQALGRLATDEVYPGQRQADLLNVADYLTIEHHKMREKRALERSRWDDLTGCLTKDAFKKELHTMFESVRGTSSHPERRRHEVGSNYAVVFIDLEKFKSLNDTYGHGPADVFLTDFSEHLRTVLRDSDLVGRFGGDEFFVALRDVSQDEIEHVVTKMLTDTPSFHHNGTTVEVGCSVGVAFLDETDDDIEAQIRRADIAMYANKQQHRDGQTDLFTIYNESLDPQIAQ